MAHGIDTEELLQRFANYKDGILNVSNLDILSIPPIPKDVKEFDCSNTSISKLPELPQSLEYLNCSNTKITKLPNLPNCIEYLECSNTKIRKMQNLPKSLKNLSCENTEITKFPRLGENLEWLNCENCPLILPRQHNEDLTHYKIRNNEFQNKDEPKNTYDSYKEELEMIMSCIKRLEKLAERHSMNVMYS